MKDSDVFRANKAWAAAEYLNRGLKFADKGTRALAAVSKIFKIAGVILALCIIAGGIAAKSTGIIIAGVVAGGILFFAGLNLDAKARAAVKAVNAVKEVRDNGIEDAAINIAKGKIKRGFVH